MSATKKKLAGILDAVASIVGDGQKAKKLKKRKALKRFIQKLEDAKSTREKQLRSGDLGKKEKAKLSGQIAELGKQIDKANNVLKDLS